MKTEIYLLLHDDGAESQPDMKIHPSGHTGDWLLFDNAPCYFELSLKALMGGLEVVSMTHLSPPPHCEVSASHSSGPWHL